MDSKEKLRLVTVTCCIKKSEEVTSLWDQNDVNEFYRGVMPKWLDDVAHTGIEKLQYYEVKESELEENEEWLK
ncbi:unnamed protein product [Microthlaspi erraticum]|uniref:Uncharacterized protein n=1 Tax=Microthlaspi erraticum TaxID=1685480 RepID=A0A6D2JP66_9BRAS|nr:unnamed protein product [Microthlaspi erraticum]